MSILYTGSGHHFSLNTRYSYMVNFGFRQSKSFHFFNFWDLIHDCSLVKKIFLADFRCTIAIASDSQNQINFDKNQSWVVIACFAPGVTGGTFNHCCHRISDPLFSWAPPSGHKWAIWVWNGLKLDRWVTFLLALVQAEPSMQQNVFYAQPQMGQQPIMMMPSMAGMTPMAGFVGGGAGQFYQQVRPKTVPDPNQTHNKPKSQGPEIDPKLKFLTEYFSPLSLDILKVIESHRLLNNHLCQIIMVFLDQIHLHPRQIHPR